MPDGLRGAPKIERSRQTSLEWKHIAPGLIYIFLIDLLGITDWFETLGWLKNVWVIPLVVLPWGWVLASPELLQEMGFHRQRWVVNFGWGVVAGGFWRAASLGINLALSNHSSVELGWGELFSAILIVPWIEETFFRGYLGRGLARQWGFWPSLLVQSTLFAFHPTHWAQGWPHWISIFGFGCLAGWLVDRRQSIWSAWGAHAFANLIPNILRPFV